MSSIEYAYERWRFCAEIGAFACPVYWQGIWPERLDNWEAWYSFCELSDGLKFSGSSQGARKVFFNDDEISLVNRFLDSGRLKTMKLPATLSDKSISHLVVDRELAEMAQEVVVLMVGNGLPATEASGGMSIGQNFTAILRWDLSWFAYCLVDPAIIRSCLSHWRVRRSYTMEANRVVGAAQRGGAGYASVDPGEEGLIGAFVGSLRALLKATEKPVDAVSASALEDALATLHENAAVMNTAFVKNGFPGRLWPS